MHFHVYISLLSPPGLLIDIEFTHFIQGAALASTSLGTTFCVLRSQTSKFDLGSVRLGSVLTGAALIDDIIALVLLSCVFANAESSMVAEFRNLVALLRPWGRATPQTLVGL